MLKKNLFFSLVLSVSQIIFPLITFPYSVRILGPEGIGSINFIDSITQYFLLIAALGIPTYGVREIAKCNMDKELLGKLFSEILAIHLISTTILAALYLIAAFFIPTIKEHLDLVFSGIALMYCSAFVVEWFYNGIEQFSYITIRSLIVRIVSIALLFMVLKPGAKPITYYALIILSSAISAILNMINVRKYAHVNIKHLELKKHLRPLLILLSSILAVSVYVLMDNIILGFIKGEEAVGIYSTAIKIVKIPFAILLAMNAAIIPRVSVAYQAGQMDQIQQLIRKSFIFLCLVGLPVSAGIFVTADFLIKVFAGDKFLAAIPLLKMLSPVIMIVGLTFIYAAQLLTPMGNEKPLLRVSIIGMFFSLITNMLLIPRFSYVGASITNILTELVVVTLCYRLAKRQIDLALDIDVFIKCLIGALLFIPISLGVRTLNISMIYKEIVVILMCAVSYIIYIWIFIRNPYVEQIKLTMLLRLRLIKQV